MLNNTVQYQRYHKQEFKNEFSNLYKILRFPIHICWIFAVLSAINKYYFPDIDLGIGVYFSVVITLLLYYWMPNKKEMEEWNKKNHSTF